MLEYRRLDLKSCLHIHFPSPLLTKKGFRTKDTEKRLRERLIKYAKKWCWEYAPRAKIAVSFRFADREKNHPDVHSLVKFYLDILKGIVFEDDRQVHYLEASTWRFRSQELSSSVFIQIRRLADYDRYVELGSHAEAEQYERDSLPFSPYHLDQHYWDIAEKQYELLSGTEVLEHSRVAQNAELPSIMDLLQDTHPLIFDLGRLPSVDGTSAFKTRVSDVLNKYVAKHGLFSHIYVPVELNAQITKQAFGLTKDLDNLMRLICPLIKEKLLHRKSHINGYRAYVIDDEKTPPRLSIQLLPPGGIEKFDKRIDAGFEAYGKSLE